MECYAIKNKAEAMRLRLKGSDKRSERKGNKTKMMIEVETLIKRLLVAMRDEHEWWF